MHLRMDEANMSHTILVQAANFNLMPQFTECVSELRKKASLNLTVDAIVLDSGRLPQNSSAWVQLGTIQQRKEKFEIPLSFSVPQLTDGTKLSTVVSLSGLVECPVCPLKADKVIVTKTAQIKISAVVSATPSLQHSNFEMPTDVIKGQNVVLSIQAKDDDNMPISKGRGRFIELKFRQPNGNWKTAYKGKPV